MHQIKGVTKDVFNILVASLNYARPKTDEEYFASADCRREFKKLLKDGGKTLGPDGREIILIDDDESVSMTFEDASFRFLEKAFRQARESGDVYLPAGAEQVVLAMEVMKNVEKVKKDDSGNGSGATKNRAEKASS